jgi:hypothetical protein
VDSSGLKMIAKARSRSSLVQPAPARPPLARPKQASVGRGASDSMKQL